jgi:hypothetical protein
MKFKPLLPIVLIFIAGCSEITEFSGAPIRQYASSVIDFSSQYDLSIPQRWYAVQTLGKEDVYDTLQADFGYGDNALAWSPLTADGQREYLVLGFDTIQTVNRIEIYETYYPGAIDTVYLRNADTGKWKLIYSKPAVTDLPEEARIFKILLGETPFLVDAIRLAINSPAISDEVDENGNKIENGWNEIDAVAITGQRKK